MCFGATSRKLLGFIATKRRTDVDPTKNKPIHVMPATGTAKEVQRFQRRLIYIEYYPIDLDLRTFVQTPQEESPYCVE